MSFLPYEPSRSSSWVFAFGGSTAMHGAVVLGLLTSSVALLPEPTSPAVREPEYEITLEILDADIIEIEDEPLIPPDAIPLNPDEGVVDELEQAEDLLAPQDEADLLAPDEEVLQPEAETLEPEVEEALAPEPEVLAPEEETLAPVEEEFAVLEPEPETPPLAPEPELVPEEPAIVAEPAVIPEPVAPVVAIDPDDVAIDDLSPIDNSVFSPLAEAVAPAAEPEPTLLAPDVVIPEVSEPDSITVEEDIAAVILPEPTLPTPDIIAPETEVALPTPEIVEPEPEVLEPEPEVVAPEPEVVEPEPDIAAPEPEPLASEPEVVAPDSEVAPEPDETPPADPEIAAEDAPGGDGTINGAPIIDAPSPAVRQIGALLQRIRATPAPQCTLALPRRSGADGVGVSFIGSDVGTLDTLAARIVDGLEVAPTQTREVLDARQCAMLDAVRQSAAYPASRIGLAVEETTLRSGDSLQARVVGAGGLFLTLLLIDDNGVVQDLARFTSLDGNDPVIEVPVARAGPARDTRQVLLVLGSPDAPIDLGDGIGREAQDAFGSLGADVLESAVFGLVTFDVR